MLLGLCATTCDGVGDMSEKIQVTILYPGRIIGELDNKIIEAMKSAGGELYAAGYTSVDDQRDICFDFQTDADV